MLNAKLEHQLTGPHALWHEVSAYVCVFIYIYIFIYLYWFHWTNLVNCLTYSSESLATHCLVYWHVMHVLLGDCSLYHFFILITHLLKWCTGSTNITTVTMWSGADPTSGAEKIKTSTTCSLYDSLLSWFQNFDASLLLTTTLQTSPPYDSLLFCVCVCVFFYENYFLIINWTFFNSKNLKPKT